LFTAPQAGVYRFTARLTVTAQTGRTVTITLRTAAKIFATVTVAPGTTQTIEINTLAKLAANSAVYVEGNAAGGSGSGGSIGVGSYFNGNLEY
jgi:hypothetical protein